MFIQNNEFIHLQNDSWLEKQRTAGKITANTLSLLESLVKNKTTKSLLELDKIAEDYILKHNCLPTFKNYHGFPNSVCISVNKALVHGIPTDYNLQDGDVVSFDLGATYGDAIADSALTCIYGGAKSNRHIDLINTTNECLEKAIQSIEIGKKIGCIGNTIYKHAQSKGYAVVDKFGGHGIFPGKVHAAPFISNRSQPTEGVRFQKGMVIAIEPLLVIGSSNKTTKSNDGWTIYADDISCHVEHTIFIHENSVEILTERN